MKKVNDFLKLLRAAIGKFIDDDGLKLSASLSFYAIFSLAPLVMIVMAVTGMFLGAEAAEGKIYEQINGVVGNSAAVQIQEIIRNIQTTRYTLSGAIIGGIILFVGVTGVFVEMQQSLNCVWSVKTKPRREWIKFLLNRLLSFSLIVSFAFILLVSLVVDALTKFLRDGMGKALASTSVNIFVFGNLIIIFLTIAGLCACIYKLLPDAKIKWRDSFIGAFLTALLFMVGKSVIGFYVSQSEVGLAYGAAGAVIILLLWVYYSSIIFFFGAEFTCVFAIQYGGGVKADESSIFFVKQEVKEIGLIPLPE